MRSVKHRWPLMRRSEHERAANRDWSASQRRERDLLHQAASAHQAQRNHIAALISTLVTDYYREQAHIESGTLPREQLYAILGRQEQAVTVLARLTGVDTLAIGWSLEQGHTAIVGVPDVEGETRKARIATLTAPFTGHVYATCAPERQMVSEAAWAPYLVPLATLSGQHTRRHR